MHQFYKTPKWVLWDFFFLKKKIITSCCSVVLRVRCSNWWCKHGFQTVSANVSVHFKFFATTICAPFFSWCHVITPHKKFALGHFQWHQEDGTFRALTVWPPRSNRIHCFHIHILHTTHQDSESSIYKQTWPKFTVVVEERRILRNTNTTTTLLNIEPYHNWMACVCSKKETNQSPTKLLHLLPGVGWSFIIFTCFHSHNNHT